MKLQTDIREHVSRSYTQAVTQPGSSCCGGGCGAPKGVLAKMAGYDEQELAALPDDAVVNSFGCGNPLAFSGVRPGETVLDLGSGAGIDLLIAARKVGPDGRVIGVDMTDAMIARARENIAAAGLSNVEIRKGLIEELPVESASVDWVISNCVINLSPDKPRVFAEIARVLRPGGRMRVSDIVAEELPADVLAHPGLYASCISGAISEGRYLAGLRTTGLTNVEVESRVTYDAAQLAALVGSELTQDAATDALARRLAGRISSVVIVAQKPARDEGSSR